MKEKIAWGLLWFFCGLMGLSAVGQLVLFLIHNPYPGG
jgi:hypothetical protein